MDDAIEKICQYVEKKYTSPPLHAFAKAGKLKDMRDWALLQLSYPEARTDDCDPDDIGRLGRLIDKIQSYQLADAEQEV